MKTRHLILIGCLAALSAPGQGFVNLNFESARPAPFMSNGTTYSSFATAFPGWVGYFGTTPAANVLLNDYTLGSSGLSLMNQPAGQFGGPISNYTALLQGGGAPFFADVALAQTGVVPDGTRSLHFLSSSTFGYPVNPFVVTLNGQPVSVSILQDFPSTFPTLHEFVADISAFANRTAELRFTQPHGPSGENNFFLDNIAFSPNPVPEPSVWALLALGGAAFWSAMRRRRK